MPRKDQAVQETALELLEAACERNLAAEIHYEEHDEFRRARTRLLSVQDEEVHVDQPQSIGSQVALRPRQMLTVYFVLENTAYAFRTTIIRPIIVTDLNHQKRVKGAALKLPSKVSQEQRRHDFRLSLANNKIDVSFHRTDPDQSDSCPIDSERFEGRITNMSGGGLAIMLPVRPGIHFRVSERLYILFALPGVDERLVMPVEVRNQRRIHDDENLILGLQFRDDPAINTRPLLQRIRRFISDQERAQLRRR